MLHTHVLSAAAPSHGWAQRLAEAMKARWDGYWRRRAARATICMLHQLDDRALHDIGLDRSEIESLVCGKPHDRAHRYEEWN